MAGHAWGKHDFPGCVNQSWRGLPLASDRFFTTVTAAFCVLVLKYSPAEMPEATTSFESCPMTCTPSPLFRSVPSSRRRTRRLAFEILEDRSLLSVFTLPQSVFIGPSASPQSVAVADFNRDGKPDGAVANNRSPNLNRPPNARHPAFSPLPR